MYRKVLRAPDKAAKTGRFMVVLSMGITEKTFKNLVEYIRGKSKDVNEVVAVNGIIAKFITARLSKEDLKEVSSIM